MEKVEGLSTQLSFLGITLDNVHMEARLPVDKLMRIKQITTLWLEKRKQYCLLLDYNNMPQKFEHLC